MESINNADALEPDMFLVNFFNTPDFAEQMAAAPSIITLPPEMFEIDSRFQSLEEVHKLDMLINSSWHSMIGPMSFAQHAMDSKKTYLVLTRYDALTRPASLEEINEDYRTQGEKIVGQSIDENPELLLSRAAFAHNNTLHYYEGPTRIITAYFSNRVMELRNLEPHQDVLKHLPIATIKQWLDELGGFRGDIKIDDFFLNFQTYFLYIFHGNKIYLNEFDTEDVDLAEPYLYGTMVSRDNQLLFLFEGEEDSIVDFTDHIQKVN